VRCYAPTGLRARNYALARARVVDLLDHAVEIVDVDDVVQVLDERSIARLGRREALSAFALRGDEPRVLDADRRLMRHPLDQPELVAGERVGAIEPRHREAADDLVGETHRAHEDRTVGEMPEDRMIEHWI